MRIPVLARPVGVKGGRLACGLRRAGRPRTALPPGQKWFTASEVAALLGIKPASVGAAVRRNRLAAAGAGKARRFPLTTVEALQDRLCEGASVETSNQYFGHLKAFGRWLVRDRRVGENPFAHLEAGNSAVDRRHDRCELTAEELRELLVATRDSACAFRGLSGQDRFALYATACGSGFRAGGLASLTPESFDLGADLHEETSVKTGARRLRDFPDIHPASAASAARHAR